ncbi:hypothetical protein F5878DRAFT_667814 [Lentinula raphanica]|uniref:Uncharacterized protein n=1 Tax=Lentinula raphanica TaxID=153919 RepID=A0AA38U2I1_9AGAR|nr:hypothetical protein F5878DRAFT_667814 [Lentinula raphanica]
MADEHKYATPQPRQSTKYAISQSTPHPEVRLQPLTPSFTSKSIQKARGLTRELDAEVERARTAQNKSRNIGDSIYTNAEFSSIVHDIPPAHVTPALKKNVTGLTNAVDSPAKGALSKHYLYKSSNKPREVEVRLLTVMNTIQGKRERHRRRLNFHRIRNFWSARALREKTLDMNRLRDEVERLADVDAEDHEKPVPFDPMSILGTSRDADAFGKTVRTDSWRKDVLNVGPLTQRTILLDLPQSVTL